MNHRFLVAGSLRYQLDILDDYLNPKKEKSSELQFVTVHLGAQEPPTTLASIEVAHAMDSIFHCFCLRLAEYLNMVIPPKNWPDGKHITLQPDDKVWLFLLY